MRELEEQLASAVEATLLAEQSRSLGTRRRRDAQDDSGIKVDFTYDEADPPVALEVTTTQDDHFRMTAYEAAKLSDRLAEGAAKEGLKPFIFTINEEAEVRGLYEPMMQLMRVGESIRTGIYGSEDLRAWDDAGTLDVNLDQHRMLRDIGVAEAQPAPKGGSVRISTYGETAGEWAPAEGLETVISANLSKLMALRPPYETHLVVGIGQYRISQFASQTPVPVLPDGLDRLWLAHLWSADGQMRFWSIIPGDRSWREHPSIVQSR